MEIKELRWNVTNPLFTQASKMTLVCCFIYRNNEPNQQANVVTLQEVWLWLVRRRTQISGQIMYNDQ